MVLYKWFNIMNKKRRRGGVKSMGFRIKECRKELNMSQEELSKRSGVSRTIISGLENGIITVTTTETLLKIAKALDKKVADIFFEQ